MQYGICTGLSNYEILEELGYDYIELSVTATMALEESVREAYRKKMEASSIRCQAFNILFPKTMDLIGGGTKDEDLKEYLHQAMELIQSFGAQIAVFGSGKCRRCPDNMTYGDAYKRLTEVCWITGEIAKQYGVNIVIEPLSRKETNLICTMAEGAILVEDISLENVGLLADYYHVMSNHDSIGDIRTIRQFGHIHIASANGRRYPLSETNEAYRELYRELHAIGYNGRISIEGKTENIRSDGADALKFLRGLEKEIYG